MLSDTGRAAPEYRVTVVAGRSRPRFRSCIYRKRNPAGGWDAVYISGREHLKDILLASKGAAQVQVRENEGPREM